MICLGLTVYNYSEISVPFYVRVSFSRTCGWVSRGLFLDPGVDHLRWSLFAKIKKTVLARKHIIGIWQVHKNSPG